MTLKFEKKNMQTLILFLFIIFVTICRYLLKAELGDVIFPVEVMLFSVLFIVNHRLKERRNYLFWIYLIFILYREVVSFVIAKGVVGDASRILYKELGVLMVVAVIVREDNQERLLVIIRDVGIVNAILGVIEFITKANFLTSAIVDKSMVYMKYSMNTSAWRVRTFFFHPIICAAFITISWIALLYYPLKRKTANFAVSLCMIISLLGTKSRSSWISLAFVTLLFLLARFNKGLREVSRNGVYWAVASVVILFILYVIFWEKVIEISDNTVQRMLDGLDSNNAGNYNRIAMIKMGIADWIKSSRTKKLFGNGSVYAIKFLKMHSIRGWNRAVDNSYLTVLMNYGLIGEIFVLIILIGAFIRFITTCRREEELATLAIISIFISGFFYDIYGWFTCTICLSLFLAVLSKGNVTNNTVALVGEPDILK